MRGLVILSTPLTSTSHLSQSRIEVGMLEEEIRGKDCSSWASSEHTEADPSSKGAA